ncbi:hypothetical protein Ae406Ps2_3011c [Pseudonocardia sp. Ae406_Ps2]|uniref:hypothetical protein n=1 Tax=unclassified Pseudonocardia TaxID=2619320 RepID=UPI00095D78A3|nr:MULTISPECIES: hypothetical protein [unclassified Pseudonocardia]OLL99249.1 hypothetical protein Ae331Ps2_2916 [Pseudonocardia sp. Ae331_Ps2]OLM03011.1 hypothetical protein Ae406Ps2_3011c [Pseudonocardia sp. Ae406_Ps2]OLM12135.1 hypothetical protein Ae505Ps2_2262 [Pseudonocardia sp. Ae505_Ps2]
MKFRARKTFRFGPLRATVNQSGRWSFAIQIGRLTHNLTRRTTSFDTPGPGGFHHQHRPRRRGDAEH